MDSNIIGKALQEYKQQDDNQKWQKLKQRLSDSDITQPEVEQIANHFVEQLKIDEQAEEVSDCAYYAPRLGNGLDLKTKISHTIALKLFPLENDGDKSLEVIKTWSYIRYTQLISKLSNKFKQQIGNAYNKRVNFKKIQLSNQRQNFCDMKHEPISEQIAKPTAMPVKIAVYDDLADFFNYLESNYNLTKSTTNDDTFKLTAGTSVTKFNNSVDHIQFTKGTMFIDGRMDLCKQVVGPDHIQALIDSIKHNQHIKHFLLGNNIVNFTGAKAIAEFIGSDEHKSKIITWYLAGNRINTEGIKLIAEALEKDQNCISLWLKRNPLMSEGGLHLGKMLSVNQHIKILDLHNTGLMNEGVDNLFKYIHLNNNLKYLYIDANGISKVDPIVNYFNILIKEQRKGIQNLWIDMNRLDDEGSIKLVETLKDYSYLKRLCMGSNRISHVASNYILQNLQQHPNLILLDLGIYKSTADMGELPNNINNDGVDSICNFLENNNKIKVMSIEYNAISAFGLDKIIESLLKNSNILYLYYKQYGICLAKDMVDKIKYHLEGNIKRQLNMNFAEFMNNKLRYIKHGNKVRYIDSIYRNSDK